MASPNQTWAKDPESGAGTPSTPFKAESTVKTADTSRTGGPITGDMSPIMAVENLVSSPVWGVNAPAGGVKSPENPGIPVTKGE